MVKIKNKIVILGKNGFIASNLRKYFIKKKLKSIFLSSKYINLTKKNFPLVSTPRIDLKTG